MKNLRASNESAAMLRPALFLDRDGVLVDLVFDTDGGRIDTVAQPEQLRLKFGAVAVLKRAEELGWARVVISNQPGLALGKFSVTAMRHMEVELDRLLAAEGASLTAQYYCPHHPFGTVPDLARNCHCRKPAPGMILQAAEELGLQLSPSLIIGDGVHDIKAGQAAGLRTVLLGNTLETGYLQLVQEQLEKPPDFIIKKLPELLSILEEISAA